MRVFMVVCFVSAALAQYNYGLGISSIAGSSSDASQITSQPEEKQYNKFFYSYTAPEQEFNDLSVNNEEQINNVLKKNLRVIFIKGPENTALENAVLQTAKVAAEDHTAIYVLSKQSDIVSLVNQLQEHKSNNAIKPEVHFVKYRTQTDAENAQRAIEAQYESIPGSTSNTSPTSASVLNFASKSASPSAAATNTNSKVVTTTVAPSRGFISYRNSYLPPSKRF